MGGYVRIIIAAIIWGSLGTIVRLIDLPVPVMVFYRTFFAAISVLVLIAGQRKIERLAVGKNIYLLFCIGALLALNWTSFFYSVRLTSIANAVLITYTAPIYVALLAPVILKEKVERITIVTLLISVIGMVLIASPAAMGFGMRDLAGIAWAFVSAISYAVLVILAKPLTARINILSMIFFEETFCALILSPSLFLFKFSVSPPTMLILFVLGAFHTALAAALYLSGLRTVKAQQAGIFTYLDPVSAVFFAAVILGELPSLTTIAGGLLIIVSGLILVLVTRRRIEAEIVSE
ncbi:MAG: DMT family transporter [Firmicutes bacterium]|nr:DMT family transporter [Bacillota bacterium]